MTLRELSELDSIAPKEFIDKVPIQDFEEWLKLKEPDGTVKNYDESVIMEVFMAVSQYSELDEYEKICTDLLIKLKKKK